MITTARAIDDPFSTKNDPLASDDDEFVLGLSWVPPLLATKSMVVTGVTVYAFTPVLLGLAMWALAWFAIGFRR